MSEQFVPGQTVWRISDGVPYEVVVCKGDFAWVRNNGRGNQILHENSISATDPNKPAEPEPQACPFCGSEVRCPSLGVRWIECFKTECGFRGPWRPTRLEAIAAWNRIQLRAADIFDGPEYDKIEAMATQKIRQMTIADEREKCAKIVASDLFMGLVNHMPPGQIAAVKQMRWHLAEAIRKSD